MRGLRWDPAILSQRIKIKVLCLYFAHCSIDAFNHTTQQIKKKWLNFALAPPYRLMESAVEAAAN